MARKAIINKAKMAPKYSTRKLNRCNMCGRKGGYLRKFGMCRICFRCHANNAEIPGVTKSSW